MKRLSSENLVSIALSITVALAVSDVKSQSVENVNASFEDGKVVITYDLAGSDPEQKFNLSLYGSHDYYGQPLVSVAGDIGANIAAGAGKRIEWDAAAVLRDFKGHIIFKLKGEAVALPFVFKTPLEGSVARRGKSIHVQWKGGVRDEPVTLELLRDGQRVQTVTQTENNGTYIWQLPKNLKTGKYSLSLSTPTSGVRSQEFQVKAKIPMMLKVLPFIAIGATAVLISGSGGGEPGGTGSTSDDLPAAPGPK